MKSLLSLNKYFYKYRWKLLAGLLFVAISVIFGILPAELVRESFNIVEDAIAAYRENPDFDYSDLRNQLILYGVIIIGSSLLKGLFMFFMRQTIIVVSRHIEYDMKNEIYDQYQKLSLAFYKRNRTGDLMNRISEDVSRVRMYVGPAIMYTMNVGMTLLLIIPIMIYWSPRLSLYVLAPLPLLATSIYYVSRKINVKSEQVQRQLSAISSFVQETFSGIRVLKAYVREEKSLQEFNEEANHYFDRNKELFRINALFFPLMILLIGLSTILTVYIGGQETIAGKIETGVIAQFIIYVNMLTWPVASIGWVTSLVQRAAASQERINEFLRVEPEIKNPSEEELAFKGGIHFKEVSFTYPDTGIKAIDKLSFKLEPGKSLAIVGRTGSGKSTVANLIGRLYDVDEGELLIDGQDIRKVNLDVLRQNIGYVPQEAFLFSNSIGANIAFGRDGASEEEIIAAAKNAHVHDNIMDFPDGYQTKVGERGVTLSGGQKQRVSIARAIIKAPPLLIFDDCLSAVDTETEEAILSNLKKLIDQSTSLIISHRVSSVKNADHILVLENGRVIEEGNHDTLMQEGGYYQEMYEQQLLELEKGS
ncbi:ABC transporter ATP-binding protein [Croceimicrobium hydrocarbonivorans]|uniref:ABC transporter ATP-binding protein n=1 Tax=Croceimicrobium hydrocarbonivorans TaxID=2761580 RepID=A0A7H0VE45_9FLAO|nr:ABC transporter ATP-binding protein [Croceimicrobium hydrocarbonivorans]QNR23993.1 ABC transporter ATP-binding protein [Croceimicrobium hydrocarbonivorans]